MATMTDQAQLAWPAVAEDVKIDAPTADGGPWIVHNGQQRYFRVGADLVRLLRTMDGRLDHAGLGRALGDPWTTEQVGAVVVRLGEMGLLADGTRRPRRRRLSMPGPLTVQFTLFDPGRMLARLRPVVASLMHRWVGVVATAIGLGGLVSLAASWAAVSSAVSRPVPLLTYFALLVGILLTTAVHEIGHGALLTYFGGRPHRMGVMLFYLTPALFCDVSDGWRLPHGRQRVLVALAGVITQWVIAGAAAISAPFLPDDPTRAGLLLFALLTYVTGILNLLPLVKLDGYLALMSHLDIPHLRRDAMADARGLVAACLFGGSRVRTLPRLSWSTPYGLLCMVFPAYLVGTAVLLWSGVLERWGAVGSALLLVGLGALVLRLGRGYQRLVRVARAAGAPRWRITAVTALLAGAVTAVMFAGPVPHTVNVGYMHDDGRLLLVLPDGMDPALVHDGATVRLSRSGVVSSRLLAVTSVAGERGRPAAAPIAAFAPVQDGAATLATTGYPLRPVDAAVDDAGTAELDVDQLPVGRWIYSTLLAPALRAVT